MDARAKSLGIDRLSIAERILLVGEIWDSIAAEGAALEVPQSNKDELDRRLTDHETLPDSGSSWEDVKSRLRK